MQGQTPKAEVKDLVVKGIKGKFSSADAQDRKCSNKKV